MKTTAKKLLCSFLAAATAFSFAACSSEVQESDFDNPLPWHVSDASYERLEYGVAIYNTQKGEAEDKREQIADGTLVFTLEEGVDQGHTRLSMDFSVTYRQTELAGKDKGLTDTINSTVYFEPNSLSAREMQKTVTLADRENTKNNSYTITADYFGTHKATFNYFKQDGGQKTRSLPRDAKHDNEMMFFLARAQGLGKNASSNFKMVNLFDTFNTGELKEYRMYVTCGSERKLDIGDFVKDFGIEAVTDNDKTTYPVTCIATTLKINDEKSGPAYTVLYAKDAFTQGEAKHKKLPVKIDYSSYNGSKPYRHTTYTLSACSFTKTAE
ncbi:MAG: hypothetical protein J1F69_02560 [Clostridiales bacterium]|nr:hypothetical protein [Clostridiales bacterium]